MSISKSQSPFKSQVLGLRLGLPFSLLLVGISPQTFANSSSFPDVWSQINLKSPAQEASRLETRALEEAHSRTGLRWVPKLYLEAKSVNSNLTDPHLSNKGALGLDLPLYEGGVNSAQGELLQHSLKSQEDLTSQLQPEQYSQVGLHFATLGVIETQNEKLRELRHQTERLLKNYQLGSKSNPVGYSGLLGMKSLVNRLMGLHAQSEAHRISSAEQLTKKGFDATNLKPKFDNASEFVSKFFPLKDRQLETAGSFELEALKKKAKAGEQATKIEKAKYLPKVNVFAESTKLNSTKETIDGTHAGIYLQWNLFDPGVRGVAKEAKFRELALQKTVEAFEQTELAEKASLVATITALKETIKLLQESYGMAVEQSKITEGLFKSGSLNILQFIEILNQRAELIVKLGEAELALVRASTTAITKEKFELAKYVADN
ncbi:MAG: TolC family protein [Bdellovibrionales bacterium]|nr:TolC family protein [Bdellovibrionales bacterium]